MKCPCCKGFGKLDVPHPPEKVYTTVPPTICNPLKLGDSIPVDWKVYALEDHVRFLMGSVRHLTAMIENPVCPHCSGTGEVEKPEGEKVQR